MRFVASVTVALFSGQGVAAAADEVLSVKIRVLSGEGAFNDIKSKRAQDIGVEILDQNERPVPDATVVFKLPFTGPSGTFGKGETSFTAITGSDGRASTVGLTPNSTEGRFNIAITASFKNLTTRAVASQSNTMAGGQIGSARGGSKKYWIIGLIGAGAAGGAAVALHGGKSSPASAPPTGTTLAVGTITVGGLK